MDWLTLPLEFGPFVRALIGVTAIAILCSLVGTFVVLRGLSYIGDAMAHAVFPGIVGAFLLKINIYLGAVIAAAVTALSVHTVTARSKLKQDSAIGIVLVGMFALGLALLSSTHTYAIDLANFLIGNVFDASDADIILLIVIGALVILVLSVFYRELVLISFDETEARAIGLPVARLNLMLLMLIALVVVLSIQIVGTTLAVSLLVTSSATARLLSRRLGTMLIISGLVGVTAGVIGLYASYYLSIAPGAAIVLTNTLIFILVLIAHRRQALA